MREKLARQAEARHQPAESARHWVELLLQFPNDSVAQQALEIDLLKGCLQHIEQQRRRLFWSDISDDSAHKGKF